MKKSKSQKPLHSAVVLQVTHHMTEDKILGTMGNTLRALEYNQDAINDFYIEARRGDRKHLIATCRKWITVKGA